MKRLLPLVVIAGLGLSGCSKDDSEARNQDTNTVGNNPLTAAPDYLGAINKAHQSSVKVIDTVSLTQAINLFNVSESRFPNDLQELVTEGYLASLPQAPRGQKFSYDKITGQLKLVPQ